MTPMTTDTLAAVITAVSDIFECDPATLSGSTRLMLDLPCESIDLLEVASRMAQRYHVRVDDDAIFLRSLRARVEQEAGSDPASVIAAAYPWLRPGRAQALAAALSDPAPLVTLDDIADYMTMAARARGK